MSNLSRKIVAVGLSLTTAVWLAGSILPASAQTSAATIATLMAQIQALQAQLVALQGSSASTPASSSYSFTKDLTLGSKGADVTALQQMLVSAGNLTMPAGVAYGYFGTLTQSALAKWQAAHSVTPSVGYFGPKTRAAVAAAGGAPVGGGTGPVVVVPAGTGLVVSLASDSPSALTIGTGTAFNPALKVNLTAGATAVNVTGVTLQKSGFLANTNLNGVDIVDAAGVRHGNVVSSINADNTVSITFPSTPITVPAGQSTSMLVRFNLLTGSYTGTVNFSIPSAASITADTSAISGSFPVSGAAMNIVSGGSSLASTTIDVLTSTGSSTLNVDPTSEQEITKFRIQETSSNEGVYLKSLNLYNYGNAGTGDYGDVQLLDQVGNVLATAQPVGQYVTFYLATPYLIDKGLTKDFTIKAKLLGGTTKTIKLVVYNNYDVMLTGASTGVSVIPGAGTNDTAFPVGNNWNQTTIGSGTMTLTRATDSPSAAVTPAASSVVLAKFDAKPTGENMELRQVKFYIATSTAAAHTLTGTVSVKVNGATVYSAAASGISPTTVTTFSLSSYPILTSGQDNWITVETSIPSTATSIDTYQVKTFGVVQVKRLVTGDLIDPGVGTVDGISLAVKAASMTVTTLSVPSGNSVVAGTNGYVFAEIQLNSQAGGEDVKVSNITVTDTKSGGNYTDVSNLIMYSGDPNAGGTALSTTASTATNANTVAFSFSQPLVVSRTAPVTLYLTGNISSGATTGSHTYNVASSTSAVTAVGATTGNSLTNGSDITFAGSGQAQAVVTSGNVTASLVSGAGASPSVNQTAAIGTTQTAWFAFKLTSQFEAEKLTSLKLTATSSGSTGLATSTLRNISLYYDNGTTAFATKSQFDSCSAGTCTISFPSVGGTSDNLLPITIPTTGTTIYVKADIGGAGTADLGNSFKFLIASSTSDITAKGASSAVAATVTGTPAASAYTFVTPQNVVISAITPTVATNVGLSAGQIVGVFQVTNNGTSPILLSTSTMSFTNGGSATTTTNFKIYASAVGGGQADTSGWNSGNGYLAAAGTTGASSTLSFATTTMTAAEQQIDGGSWRYLTIKTSAASANNDTYQLSVSALGNILYNVAESSLGYTGNPSADSDLSDTIFGLYVNGTPSLSTVTAKS